MSVNQHNTFIVFVFIFITVARSHPLSCERGLLASRVKNTKLEECSKNNANNVIKYSIALCAFAEAFPKGFFDETFSKSFFLEISFLGALI